jgi:hypothetical protein
MSLRNVSFSAAPREMQDKIIGGVQDLTTINIGIAIKML